MGGGFSVKVRCSSFSAESSYLANKKKFNYNKTACSQNLLVNLVSPFWSPVEMTRLMGQIDWACTDVHCLQNVHIF